MKTVTVVMALAMMSFSALANDVGTLGRSSGYNTASYTLAELHAIAAQACKENADLKEGTSKVLGIPVLYYGKKAMALFNCGFKTGGTAVVEYAGLGLTKTYQGVEYVVTPVASGAKTGVVVAYNWTSKKFSEVVTWIKGKF